MPYTPIDRSLKTGSMAESKPTEHYVILAPFAADLSHPGLSNPYITCEIDASEAAESLTLICTFVLETSQENERGALGAEIE